MRTALHIALVSLLLLASAQLASAEKRIALVIGNSTYKSSPIRNPKNDAELMAKTLENTGFDVTLLKDVTYQSMKLAMVRFGRKLRSSDTVGLFYYAGHGVQVKGNNYLIPVDAQIEDESEIGVFAINVNEYLQTMERSSSRINIVVLDACRNNPFARSFRSQTRGLARVDAPKGTYIAYATAPGRIALDGAKENSPYTSALADAIETPGLTLEETFKKARRLVLAATDERQIPWETSSITGRFYFKPPAPKVQISVEDGTWNLVKNSTHPEVVNTYLNAYPNGKYADRAKALVSRLMGEREQLRADQRRKQREIEDRRKREAATKEAERQAELAAQRRAKAEAAAKAEAERKAKLKALAQAEAEQRAKLDAFAKAEADRQAKLEAEKKAQADAQGRRAEELSAWQAARASNDPARLLAYINKYPSGTFADLASARLDALKKLKVAALQTTSDDELKPALDEEATHTEKRRLSLSIQKQLQRLGCSPGRADGSWGRKSRAALQRFQKHSNAKLASLDPSTDLLINLKARKSRVCPIECGSRHVLKGGRCVLKGCPASKTLNSRGRCVAKSPSNSSKQKQVKRKASRAPTAKKNKRKASGQKRNLLQPKRPHEIRGRSPKDRENRR